MQERVTAMLRGKFVVLNTEKKIPKIKNLKFYLKNLEKEEQIKNSLNRRSIVTLRA